MKTHQTLSKTPEEAIPTLRAYQTRQFYNLVSDIKNGENDLLLCSPMGSGKTLVNSAILADLRDTDSGITHVVVMPPQSHIKDAHKKVEGLWRLNSSRMLNLDGLWSAQGTAQEVIDHLLQKNPLRFAITTCHTTLREVHWKQLANAKGTALKGKLLVIDEGHHCTTDKERNQLSKLAAFWRSQGGQVLLLTATPFRYDGTPVFSENTIRYVRTQAEHMEGGKFAPRVLVPRFEVLKGLKASNMQQQFGEEDSVRNWPYRRMVELWERDGKPFAIFILPAGASKKRASYLEREFSKVRTANGKGLKVLNGVGTSAENKRSFREALASGGEDLDVVLACRRADEGTDWPKCSHVYMVGLPKNIQLVTQRAGRTLRLKAEGHPWKDVATITFLIPEAANKGLREELLQKQNADLGMLMGVFLASFSTGIDYWNCSKPRSKAETHISDAVNGSGRYTDQERAEAERDLVFLEMQLPEGAKVSDYQDLIQQHVDTQGWSEERAWSALDALKDRVAHKNKKVASRLGEATEQADADTKDGHGGSGRLSRSIIRASRRGYWDEVMEEYQHLVVPKTGQEVLETCCYFTGESLKEMAERLQSDQLLNEGMILEAAKRYHERHGKWPTQDSGDATEEFGFDVTWSAVNQMLYVGRRGFSGGSSLSQFLIGHGLRPVTVSLTEAKIVAAAKVYLRKTAKLPTAGSGDATEFFGFSAHWGSINNNLQRGRRGFPGGSSLPQLLIDHGLKDEVTELTKNLIVEAANSYHEKHGKWPSNKSGDATEFFGFKTRWVNVDMALRHERHGLSGKTTLHKLLKKRGLK